MPPIILLSHAIASGTLLLGCFDTVHTTNPHRKFMNAGPRDTLVATLMVIPNEKIPNVCQENSSNTPADLCQSCQCGLSGKSQDGWNRWIWHVAEAQIRVNYPEFGTGGWSTNSRPFAPLPKSMGATCHRHSAEGFW